MKWWSVLLCSLLWALAANAATDLEALQARISPVAVLRGEFSQEKAVEGFSLPLRSTGHFVVARERGVIWDTEQPFPSRMVIGASGLRLDDQSPAAMPGEALARVNRMLVALIGGDVAGLEREFEVEAALGEEDHWKLRLQPRDAQLAKRLVGLVVAGSRWVDEVEFADEHGNRTRLSFRAQHAGDALQDAEAKALD